MRYLGIDYGKKRIGLALSDENGKIAFPYQTLPRTKRIASTLKNITTLEKVGKIIIGLPIPFSGEDSLQTKETKLFAEHLKDDLALPIEFENEVLTTKLAKKAGVAKEHIDKVSAAIILQSYLDKHLTPDN